jgi:sterol desaturase/sphingolipid hydroxylase (fatty acid hydroxylase superfamily)
MALAGPTTNSLSFGTSLILPAQLRPFIDLSDLTPSRKRGWSATCSGRETPAQEWQVLGAAGLPGYPGVVTGDDDMSVERKLDLATRAFLGAAVGDLFWYALLAAVASLFFYVVFRKSLARRRVSRFDPTGRQVAREVLHSLCSVAIFGLVTGAVVYLALSGWTRLYWRVDEYGWVWLLLSIAVMVLVHDAYFYWTHRLMHHPRLFRLVHRAHHLSVSPTPWAAYAFSPLEALVQAGIGPLIVFTIPTHPTAFAAFMGWQITFNVLGHCGHELMPRWFLRSPAGLVLNTVTHHALHHEKLRANFGLYFNVWDRLMGTNHRDYERRFDLATDAGLESSADTGLARDEPDRESEGAPLVAAKDCFT